jgi:hypothetical protein
MPAQEKDPKDLLSEFDGMGNSTISDRKSYSGTLYGIFIFIIGLFNIRTGAFLSVQFVIGVLLIIIAIIMFYKTNKKHRK